MNDDLIIHVNLELNNKYMAVFGSYNVGKNIYTGLFFSLK